MEQFPDYLEARGDDEAEAAPATASKSAGAPPPAAGTTTSTPASTSSPPASSTTADGRPEPRADGGDPPEDRGNGRPVPPRKGDDQPEGHPSSSTPAPEGAETGNDPGIRANGSTCIAVVEPSLAVRPFFAECVCNSRQDLRDEGSVRLDPE